MNKHNTGASSRGKSSSGTVTMDGRRWLLSLFAVAAIGWLAFNLIPIRFSVPERLMGVDIYSPQDIQEEADALDREIRWKMTLIRATMISIALSCLAFFAFPNRLLATLIVPVVGVLSGLAGGAVAVKFRDFLSAGGIDDIAGDLAPMLGDMLAYAILGFFVTLPIAAVLMFSPVAGRMNKALGVPLAGVVAGLVTPFAVSILEILRPLSTPGETLPLGKVVSAVWLVLLVLAVYVFTTLSTKPKAPAKEAAVPDTPGPDAQTQS